MSRRLWVPGISRVSAMFENLLRKYDETLNEVRDQDYMIQIMTAEFHLCCRLGVMKQTLIKEYEERKLEW